MEPDLVARLLSDGGLSALVGNRINYLTRVQGELLDAITITQVSPGRAYTASGPDGTHGTRVQFDIWSLRAANAVAIFGALCAAIEQPAAVGATVFQMSFLQSRRDTAEDVPGVGTVVRISADFLIWWNPA